MKYIYPIELLLIVISLFIIVSSMPSAIFVILFLGCAYILYRAYIFMHLQPKDIIYRPISILYDLYGDSQYAKYYEILNKDKCKIFMAERQYRTVKCLYFLEFVLFFYKKY